MKQVFKFNENSHIIHKTDPGFITRLGRRFYKASTGILEFYWFSIHIMLRILHLSRKKRINNTVLMRQILFTGYDALSLIGIISLSIGALIVLEVGQITGKLGETRLVYELIVVIVIRQLGIIFTAFIVIARSGTAISAELGNMVVNKEIDLLDSFGISPIEYLVIPRVIGMIVSLFTLTLYFNFLSVIGGYIFFNIVYSPVNIFIFFSRIISEISFLDISMMVVKSILFGIAIGLISCYHGLKVSGASTEVPQRTIRSVVNSVASIIILDIIATVFSYL